MIDTISKYHISIIVKGLTNDTVEFKVTKDTAKHILELLSNNVIHAEGEWPNTPW